MHFIAEETFRLFKAIEDHFESQRKQDIATAVSLQMYILGIREKKKSVTLQISWNFGCERVTWFWSLRLLWKFHGRAPKES